GGFDASGTTMITKIIAVTAAIYFLDMFIAGREHWLMQEMASSASDLFRPWYWWRFLTSGFAHAPDIKHILYNMVGLFFLGRSVEAVYGQKEILRFYLVAIVLGSVGQALRAYVADPEGPWIGCYGASGAVTGIIVLFICHFPKQMLLLFFVIPVPAWVVGILIIVMNVAGASGVGDPRVAYDVHLIGAAFALAYFKFKWNLGRLLPRNLSSVTKSLKPKPNLRVHDPDEHASDAEGDALLEKVNQHGIESLTPRERKTLEDYSRRMRQKYQ
ncbi:MAG: rhomboid family intramembrane serine protease, partial [Pirellulaceae bacterium]